MGKTKKYVVKIIHFAPYWRNGDLEDKHYIEEPKYFCTKTEAKSFIQGTGAKPSGKSWENSVKFTNKEWVNENTGEKCREYYQYILKKLSDL